MYLDNEPLAPFTQPWEYCLIELDGKQYRYKLDVPLPEGAKLLKDRLLPTDRECSFRRYR